MAAARVPPTVLMPGWAANPWKPVPSYATVMRTRTGYSIDDATPASSNNLIASGSDELDPCHRRVVAVAGAELEDARVAALAIVVPGGDLLEQLVGHLLVTDEGDDVALPGHAALLGFGDHLLGDGAQGLGLGL